MPCTNKTQATAFPTAGAGPGGAAAAPVGGSPGSQAAGATQVHLDRAKLSPLVFLLSIPLLCSPKNCVFQVQIPDLGPGSTPSSEWVFRNSGLFFYYYCCCCCRCRYCYYYYYYLMLHFASGSFSSQFPHPVLPSRQRTCFAHPCWCLYSFPSGLHAAQERTVPGAGPQSCSVGVPSVLQLPAERFRPLKNGETRHC